MGINTADVHGVTSRMGGGGHPADSLVVPRAAVGGRKGERDARQIAGLIKHLEQVGVHLLHARTAPALAAEFDRGEMTQGKNSHKKILLRSLCHGGAGGGTLNLFKKNSCKSTVLYKRLNTM